MDKHVRFTYAKKTNISKKLRVYFKGIGNFPGGMFPVSDRFEEGTRDNGS